MENISPLALAAIAFIIIVFAVINVWLVAMLRNKELWKLSMSRRPPKGPSRSGVEKLVKVLRNPFYEQEGQMSELSHLVEDLKNQPLSPPDEK